MSKSLTSMKPASRTCKLRAEMAMNTVQTMNMTCGVRVMKAYTHLPTRTHLPIHTRTHLSTRLLLTHSASQPLKTLIQSIDHSPTYSHHRHGDTATCIQTPHVLVSSTTTTITTTIIGRSSTTHPSTHPSTYGNNGYKRKIQSPLPLLVPCTQTQRA